MELNDDLMNQILIRLPVKSIFRFKCVSKPWNCFLSSAYFRREYISFRNKPWIASSSSSSSPSSLLGFFQFHSSTTRTANTAADANNNDNRPPEEELVEKFSFLPTTSEEQGEGGGGLLPLPIVSVDDSREKLGFFYCSHGGLIVCGHHPSTYYVCNPVTNQWVSLPKLDCLMDNDERGEVRYTVAIYCKEKEKHGYFRHSYKVVRPFFIPRSYSKTVSIAMYSSKTGLWKKYIAKAAENFELLSNEVCPCIIIQETIIWIARPWYFAAYNPKKSKDHIMLITFPLGLANSRLSTLGESVDGLLHCVVDDATPGFKIFVLKDKLSSYGYSECLVDDDEWVLRHTVSLDIPGMVWDNRTPRPRIHNRTAIPGLYHENLPRRIALHPQNPLLLYLRVGQSFFSCDLATGTINIVPHEGNLLTWETRYKLLPYFQLVWPLSP